LDLPFVLMDEPVRACPEVDIPRLIERIKSVHGLLSKSARPDVVIRPDHFYNIPSVARLRAALLSGDGKLALRRASVGAETVMAYHRSIYPHLMHMMFSLMAEGKQSQDSDLAGRFATAVAELDLAAFPKQPIKPRLLKLLGNVDEGQYIRVVQDSAWEYATRRLANILLGRDIGQDMAEQFERARDSAAFTNWLLTPERVSPIYAQEVLNAVELAGYEVDDLAIQHAVMGRASAVECDLHFD
jgi:hypothetical protein